MTTSSDADFERRLSKLLQKEMDSAVSAFDVDAIASRAMRASAVGPLLLLMVGTILTAAAFTIAALTLFAPHLGPALPGHAGSGAVGATPSGLPRSSSGEWTSRTFDMQGSDGPTRPCVELTNRGSTATTCVSLPGVSSWIVGGDHFVLAAGTDIRFDDGSTIRVDKGGIAIGLIGSRNIAGEAQAQRPPCDRRAYALAISERFGETSPAWLPVACTDRYAVLEFNDPSSEIAFLKRDGAWVVLGTVQSGTGCSSLEGDMRAACQALELAN
jgi:hypothetical protein